MNPGPESGNVPHPNARQESTLAIPNLRARVIKARHDLRNPLGEILGYSEMLQEEVAATDQAHLIPDFQIIYRLASQILKQVDHSLDLENVTFTPDDFGELTILICTSADRIQANASELSQRCGTLANRIIAQDLDRIAASARILREIAPRLLDTRGEFAEPPAAQALAPAHTSDTSAFKSLAESVRAPDYPLPADTHGPVHVHGSILVVEDNVNSRALLTRWLERQGYCVVPAEDGRRALELLATQAFDLVLLDIIMPEFDGHQVLARMKADERLRHLPVIMISALDDLESLVRCVQKGADDYLTKPFEQVLLRARIGACLEKKRLRDREVSYMRQIEQEKRHSNDLLRVILPNDIAEELKTTGRVKPRYHQNVGVLFCDLVNFTSFCSKHEPEEIITHLQTLIQLFEESAERHGLEKIKTIGDEFMAASGLISAVANPALACVRCGLDMLSAIRKVPFEWRVRIGIHNGPVVAGVVGSKKYLFDIWGDTVNIASRVTHVADPSTVCVSAAAWNATQAYCEGFPRGAFEVKGKGQLEIFQINGVKTQE